ncbi:MAG: hypothetical protein ACJAS4_003712 [Bacteriovoracaceae bacterium]|jgi:hypothetical protein
MKTLITIITVISSISFALAAGGVDGGGGNAVVCRDNQKNILTAKMLDLYEGEVLHGLTYEDLEEDDRNVNLDNELKELLENIYGKESSQSPYWMFKSIKENFKLLPKGVALKPISDSGHIIIPDGCKIEQVANFYNMTNIYIVSDIYNAFTPLDKLALILHEAIYLQERESFVKDSRYTRRVVAHLLSKGFKPERVYEGVDFKRDYFCSTEEILGPTPTEKKVTSFWAVRTGRDWRLQFTKINGHGVYSKKYIEPSFGNNTFPIFQDEEPNFQHSTTSVSQIHGLIDPYDIASIVISNGVVHMGGTDKFMMIKFQGFDPSDLFDYQQFKCRTRKY